MMGKHTEESLLKANKFFEKVFLSENVAAQIEITNCHLIVVSTAGINPKRAFFIIFPWLKC